ncbi:MAG TPA: DNA-formamidopyrimidine glycosylase family protein [Thermoanaerobaculia bacterium]
MPEGDTVLRVARALGRRLEGKRLKSFDSSLPRLAGAGISGRRVEAVEARGKNLLVRFDDGRALVTHMRMTGSWHLYRPGERWKKPARLARAILETDDAVAVCFSAPVVELLSARELDRNPRLRRLGPDVLSAEFEAAEAVRRLKARPRTPIGEALLFQSAIAGVGNVYKSETLFLCGMDPFAPVAFFSDSELSGIVSKARELMSANVHGWPRRTRPLRAGRGYWVYRRSGQPCRRCGTPLRMRRQGSAGRSTYWCPACQPPRGSAAAHR